MKKIDNPNLLEEARTEFKKLIYSLCNPPDEEWEFYSSKMFLFRVDKGEFYMRPGDPADIYAFVYQGLFKRYYLDEDGNPVIFSFDDSGRAISDLPSLLREQPARMFIEAIESSYVLSGPRGFYKEIRDRHVEFNDSARKITEHRYLEFVDRALELVTLSAKERLRKFNKTHKKILDRIEKKDIAAYLGIKPETLSRIQKGR